MKLLREVLELRLPQIFTCPRCGLAYYGNVGHYCFTWTPTPFTTPTIVTGTGTVTYTNPEATATCSTLPASTWIDTSTTGTSAVPIIPLEFWRSTAGPDTPAS